VTTVLRTGGDVSALAREARTAFHEIDPGQPIEDLSAMTEVVSRSLGESRLVLVIVSAFALTALLLAAIGIYGVASTAVTARSREVCIRLAMGAQQGQLFRLMIRRPLALVGGGVALGLAGTVASGALIAKLLYGVSPTDPGTIVVVTIALIAVAVLSAYGPALRATRVNAAKVLRGE
jgi:putative ABC transport system permease protein